MNLALGRKKFEEKHLIYFMMGASPGGRFLMRI